MSCRSVLEERRGNWRVSGPTHGEEPRRRSGSGCRGHSERSGARFVRVSFNGGNADLRLVAAADPATHLVGESFGVKIAVPKSDCAALTGYVIDYRSIGPEPGFVLKDPRSMHSRASDPGGVLLSRDKLRRLHPELFSGTGGFFRRLLGRGRDPGLEEYCESLAEHLQQGDSRAAVVVSITPLVVAAYTDELDCVALLRFPNYLAAEYGLRVGSRLLTVNRYFRGGERPGDLVPGPRDTKQYTNFTPIIADFLATDRGRVDRRKVTIGEDEWARAAEMGRELIGRGVTPRDGRPLNCGRPASTGS